MKHDGPHTPDDPVIDPETGERCFGCWVGSGSSGPYVSMKATPTKNEGRVLRPDQLRPLVEPSWEKGVAGEHRRDGSFMPYLDGNLTEIGIKQYGENRRKYEAARKRQLTPST